MRSDPIIIPDTDITRLRGLLATHAQSAMNSEHLEELRLELDRAIVVAADLVPRHVITMGAWVEIRDFASRGVETFQLVYPREADASSRRVSILAPLGTALLGNSEGDDVEWHMPGGVRRFRIQKVTRDRRDFHDDGHPRVASRGAATANFA